MSCKLQDNRDKRVELLQKYARKFFPSTRYLDYALTVERYTLTKAANLVLNVDGCIGALFLDLLHSSSMFSQVRSSALAALTTSDQWDVMDSLAPQKCEESIRMDV